MSVGERLLTKKKEKEHPRDYHVIESLVWTLSDILDKKDWIMDSFGRSREIQVAAVVTDLLVNLGIDEEPETTLSLLSRGALSTPVKVRLDKYHMC